VTNQVGDGYDDLARAMPRALVGARGVLARQWITDSAPQYEN